ncbi:hypothetical protein [Planctomicrobium piriforme]|uniref:YXWGXW repeat-containing protein n=1 Tax=Planctomicrobium piriforme TaxID=1576369 RepID=A0A1I3G8I9_9PLAN|nr:hypothetical protein [Planctomicrobium piriforme]SFI19773.1 hypothetical protein SAMN05421753_106238 [Planctomicrobium piriforme]
MKTFALLTAAVAGLMWAGAGQAQAGGHNHGYGYGYGNSWNNTYWGGGSNWGYQRRGHYDFHNTSHYDYVPGGVVPHGNHLHYVPGTYQWHQTGHYDYHRGNHHHH